MDFVLEKWKTNYLNDFMEAMEDPHLSDKMCETMPYPMDTAFAVEYIRDRMFNSEEKQMCRAVICEGKVIGGVDVVFGEGVFEKNGEISIWLSNEYRGQGIGSSVIAEVCRRCFEEYDILRIEAHPYSVHKEASAALVHAGFTHEGTIHQGIYKNNTAYDYEIFALLKK